MRIGILTIHDSPNYGACLQCYGLWKYLVNQGYDCEVIDLHRPGAHDDYVSSKKYRRGRKVKIGKYQLLKNFIKKVLRGKDAPKEHYNVVARERFKSFNNEIRFSLPYRSIDQLYENPPVYDVYIAGSDQLWNPLQPYCIEPYFLNFVTNPETKKISYATSMGVTELNDQEKNNFKKWLSDFTAVSVRENQAKQLLESFVGRKVEVVLDPTFLLTNKQWKNIAILPHQSEPYILLFMLGMNLPLLDYSMKISQEAKVKLLVLNQLQPKPENDEYVAIKDAGPKEFLGYIGKANMVITDSFHGTVFSLIMGAKNFYTFVSNESKVGSRIEDLLSIFGLSDHLLNPSLTQTYAELASNTVNQKNNEEIIRSKRSESCEFLEKSIKG